MTYRDRFISGGLAAVVGLAATGAVSAGFLVTRTDVALANATVLASHRAIYDVSLARTSASAGVAKLKGRLAFELVADECGGYKQTMRFVTQSTNGEGQATLSDIRAGFEERANASELVFTSETLQDRRVTKRTAGTARRTTAADPEGIDLSLQQPSTKSLRIERAALFPVQHTKAVIEAAQAGERTITTHLFDGSDSGEKVYLTTAVIGLPTPAGAQGQRSEVEGGDVLAGLSAWPVALSYFEQKEQPSDGVPEYELSFVLYENGVSSDLFIDYGTFAIRGNLKSLQVLETAPCLSPR